MLLNCLHYGMKDWFSAQSLKEGTANFSQHSLLHGLGNIPAKTRVPLQRCMLPSHTASYGGEAALHLR